MCLYLEAAQSILGFQLSDSRLRISQGCNLNISCAEYLTSFSILNVFISFFFSVNYGQIPQASSTKPICGIVGTLRLLAGPYLVIVTKKHKVGSINGQTIWQVAETEVISYSRTLLHLTEKQVIFCRCYTSFGL